MNHFYRNLILMKKSYIYYLNQRASKYNNVFYSNITLFFFNENLKEQLLEATSILRGRKWVIEHLRSESNRVVDYLVVNGTKGSLMMNVDRSSQALRRWIKQVDVIICITHVQDALAIFHFQKNI